MWKSVRHESKLRRTCGMYGAISLLLLGQTGYCRI
jgi:hypothetical protein